MQILPDEQFVQCFSPYVTGRRELPITWFISQYGNLVSVNFNSFNKTPIRLCYIPGKVRNERDKRTFHVYHNPITNQFRNIRTHALSWLVYNRDNYVGNVDKYIDMFGIYAFGSDGDKFNVNVHHIVPLSSNLSLAYTPSNLMGLTTLLHDNLRIIKKAYKSNDITKDVINRTRDVLNEEGVYDTVYVMYGYQYGYYLDKPDVHDGCHILVIPTTR